MKCIFDSRVKDAVKCMFDSRVKDARRMDEKNGKLGFKLLEDSKSEALKTSDCELTGSETGEKEGTKSARWLKDGFPQNNCGG